MTEDAGGQVHLRELRLWKTLVLQDARLRNFAEGGRGEWHPVKGERCIMAGGHWVWGKSIVTPVQQLICRGRMPNLDILQELEGIAGALWLPFPLQLLLQVPGAAENVHGGQELAGLAAQRWATVEYANPFAGVVRQMWQKQLSVCTKTMCHVGLHVMQGCVGGG